MLYVHGTKLPPSFDNLPVYLAGGTLDCPDWQSDIIKVIDCAGFDVVNPRRTHGSSKTALDEKLEIEWEHQALQQSNIVLFWFPKESECAAALFEYGRALERADTLGLRIIAGYDPKYEHADWLEQQTQLAVDWAVNDDVAVDLVSNWEDFQSIVIDELG